MIILWFTTTAWAGYAISMCALGFPLPTQAGFGYSMPQGIQFLFRPPLVWKTLPRSLFSVFHSSSPAFLTLSSRLYLNFLAEVPPLGISTYFLRLISDPNTPDAPRSHQLQHYGPGMV